MISVSAIISLVDRDLFITLRPKIDSTTKIGSMFSFVFKDGYRLIGRRL